MYWVRISLGYVDGFFSIKKKKSVGNPNLGWGGGQHDKTQTWKRTVELLSNEAIRACPSSRVSPELPVFLASKTLPRCQRFGAPVCV